MEAEQRKSIPARQGLILIVSLLLAYGSAAMAYEVTGKVFAALGMTFICLYLGYALLVPARSPAAPKVNS